MRILIRTSKWAVWARRFGALALPLAVIPVLMHRGRLISSENFVVIEAVAIGFAVLAVFAACVAIVRLWFTGDQGWGRAAVAMTRSASSTVAASGFSTNTCAPPSMDRIA